MPRAVIAAALVRRGRAHARASDAPRARRGSSRCSRWRCCWREPSRFRRRSTSGATRPVPSRAPRQALSHLQRLSRRTSDGRLVGGDAPRNPLRQVPRRDGEATCRLCCSHSTPGLPSIPSRRPRGRGRGVRVAQCASCHATRDGAPWMSVRRATPESCQGCHTHRASGPPRRRQSVHDLPHRDRARHDGRLKRNSRRSAKPPSHDDARFPSSTAPEAKSDVARCATCHARRAARAVT